jgi:hypothetical protein
MSNGLEAVGQGKRQPSLRLVTFELLRIGHQRARSLPFRPETFWELTSVGNVVEDEVVQAPSGSRGTLHARLFLDLFPERLKDRALWERKGGKHALLLVRIEND